MSGLESTVTMANRVAQRRVGLVLLPLRLWLGLAWLRSGVSKVIDPGWFDGSAVSGFLHGQLDGGGPLAFYGDVMSGVWNQVATPLGVVVLVGEILIGVGLLTGTLTNLALLSAILLNVNFILAGDPSPSQLYIVIELVLLAGGAGACYSVDRWLSLHLRSPLVTGERGLLDGNGLGRATRIGLTVMAVGVAAAVVPFIGEWLPERGVDDPAFTLFALALVAVLLVRLAGGSRRPAGGSLPERRLPMAPPDRRPPLPASALARAPMPMPARSPALDGPPSAVRRQSGPPRHQPPPAWPAPSPLQAAPRSAGRVMADAPTTQFRRPARAPRPPVNAADPYAELRHLPPPDLSR